ncbi:MAG: hypothetical protein QG673_1899 [Pseudomonadota bacterium]|nr:hypothetical protein [Pseudomonadota bacterium]
MNLEQIQIMVSNGESDTTEFKKSTAQLKSACETGMQAKIRTRSLRHWYSYKVIFTNFSKIPFFAV